MISSAVVCAWAVVAVTSLASASVTDPPVSNNLSGPPPECSLSARERSKLNELIFRKFDAGNMLVGRFTELWTSQFSTKNVPYCLKTYVQRSEENNMLKQIVVVKNTKTNDQEETITYLQRLEENVYLVRKGNDMKPVSRIYIVFAEQNAIATFQCTVTGMTSLRQLLARIWGPPKMPGELELPTPANDPEKMAVISIPQAVTKVPLDPEVEKPLNQAWEMITKNEDLFGRPAETEPCILMDGDIEQSQVAKS